MDTIDVLDTGAQNLSMEDHLKNSGIASVPWSDEHETILVEWADIFAFKRLYIYSNMNKCCYDTVAC